jgi:hypothetical protein
MNVQYIFYKKTCQGFTRQKICAYNSRKQAEVVRHEQDATNIFLRGIWQIFQRYRKADGVL